MLRPLAAEIVLLLKLLLQLQLLLLLLLHLLQVTQQLLRRLWRLRDLLPKRRVSWLLLNRARSRARSGIRCRRLPGDGLDWWFLGFAVRRCFVGGVVFLYLRRRGRRRSWSSRCGSSRLFAGGLPHGEHDPGDGIRLLLRANHNVVIARAVQ